MKDKQTPATTLCPSEVCNREGRCMAPGKCDQEIAEAAVLLGGTVEPVTLSLDESAALERHMDYVARYGHQP